MLAKVYGRHAAWADGRRRKGDHHDAELVEFARILRMHIGRSRIKGNLYLVLLHIGQQAVYAIGGGLHAHVPGACQPFGPGIDSDHPDGFEDLTALDLVDQVGTNIARPDQRALDFSHEPCSGVADSLATRMAIVSPAMAKFSG